MKSKMPYAEALELAKSVVDELRPYVERIEIAGSIRRKRPEVGDIEIVAIASNRKDMFGEPIPGETRLDAAFPQLEMLLGWKLVKNGSRLKQFTLPNKMSVDLFLTTWKRWGSIYTLRTGSHEFNLWLVGPVAKARGIKFEEGLLFVRESGAVIETPEEEDVFRALGLDYIPPEKREQEFVQVISKLLR